MVLLVESKLNWIGFVPHLYSLFWRDLLAQKANGTAAKLEAKKLGRRRPDLLDDLSEKMSDAFWVWNASEYDIVAVTAFEAGF